MSNESNILGDDQPLEVAAIPAPKPEPSGDAASAATGPEVITAYLKTLPAAPGVYRMIDSGGDVIYVGKARSLKARVSNYARLGGHSNRIARMISLTASMEFVRVNTEAEALLLEANLIKRFRPRFNVLMRDDKSFPYILIADTNDAPQILKHRGARTKKGDFFGPFASAGAVDRTINMLQRAFLLRTCTDSVFEQRTRPCLLYQIKRCSAPCTGEIAKADYQNLVDEAKRFLRGESQNVRRMYQDLMEAAAADMAYEEAAKYRNRLWALAHVTSEQSINAQSVEEADVFAAHQDGGQTCIQVFFFRSGQNWGNRAYFPKADRALETADVLESFIAQFYDDKPVPRLILLSHDLQTRELLAEALSIKAARKVSIQVPKRGDKTDLVTHAHQNAREALGRRLAESASQRTLLEGLAERFGLDSTPRRVEVYDNSHISGSHAVGAMIVAGPEGLIKNQYRKFNIKSDTITPGDDYAMMREVLTRRFKRLINDHAPASTVAARRAATALNVERSRITGPAIVPPGQRGADGVPFGTVPAAAPGPKDRNSTGAINTAAESAPKPTPPLSPHSERATRPGAGAAPAEVPGPKDRNSTGAIDTAAESAPKPTPPLSPLSPHSQGATRPGASAAPAEVPGPQDRNSTVSEEDSEMPSWPDLVLVDGGAGQLAVARDVFDELGIEGVALVGVAKGPDRDAGREHFHRVGAGRPIMLEPRDPVLYFIQRLRDEAHRFAIGTHRAKRSKALIANPLDEIDGIGPARKRALLSHFGSAKAVSRAGIEDMKAVPGISAEMAQKIYDFFHEKRG